MNWIEYTESKWRNFDMTLLGVDESYINLLNETSKPVLIYYRYEDCYMCAYQKLRYDKQIILDGSRSINFKIFDKDQGKYVFDNETNSICDIESYLGEFGVYNLSVLANKNCSVIVDKEPVNVHMPIVTLLLVTLLIALCYKLLIWTWNKYIKNRFCNAENIQTTDDGKNKKKRLLSLDVFRGFVITLMIFVNSGGGHYFWIEHAPWNGLHVADVVFPWFLWIMGVAIPFSIHSQLNRSISKMKLLKHIFVRSVKLFLIGLCLNSMFGPSLENLRIMGVLQRFGISYFVCASFYLLFSKSNISISQGRFAFYISDLIVMRESLLLCLILIIIYLTIIFGLKIPNCPQGYLGPGGIHDYAVNFNCTGGAIGYIDELILGRNHIYQHSTAKKLYNSKNFDPEGLFGCLMSIVQVFLGIQCGTIFRIYSNFKAKCSRMIIWSVILVIIGGSLCFFSKEDGAIPINKNLWSLSFVMITSAMAFFVLLLLHVVIDEKEFWKGFPFLQAGMNSIILYVGHSVLHKMLPWHWKIGLMNTHFILALEALWNTTLWLLISCYLYKKNIFYNI
ncbi:heparan-alpha-glucosaminide N-acetyltransferase [Condylostylus longicornis]|uniref:heparan-alpha-glucosaminide N-acetyltransferase n=1 Tax=Condylostylus longicornis TaxID=2530218 RepID=UPI00244E5639|nr:heparan-alpha-glucosaminide N-acetyltransferase [Condylostylus longicornis]